MHAPRTRMQNDDADHSFPLRADRNPTNNSSIDTPPLFVSAATGPYKNRFVQLFERVHENCIHTGMRLVTVKTVLFDQDERSGGSNKKLVYVFDMEDGSLYKQIVEDDVHGQEHITSRLKCEDPTEYAAIINTHLVRSASRCDPSYRHMTEGAQVDYNHNYSIVK